MIDKCPSCKTPIEHRMKTAVKIAGWMFGLLLFPVGFAVWCLPNTLDCPQCGQQFRAMPFKLW